MDEVWRDVPGWEGYYQASDQGRVRSLDRFYTTSTGKKVPLRGQVLATPAAPSGHTRVSLVKSSRREDWSVHRLILFTFVGPPPDSSYECLHGNGIPGDNRLLNLRWGTVSENRMDSVRHKTHRNSRKTHCKVGHPLVPPNLRPTNLLNGQRQCWSCAREKNLAWNQKRAFSIERADLNYLKITGVRFER